MDIQLFNSPQFGPVRASGTPDNPLFCASDVCRALGYSNGRKAIADHCDEGDVTKCDTPTASGIQSMTFVNESGLFSLIFGSKMDSARHFKRWVTSDVLPTIRRTGGYLQAKPEETPEEIMAKAMIIANRTIELQKQRLQMLEGERNLLKKENEALAPKAEYADKVLQSTSTYTHTQMAKDLGFRSVNVFLQRCKDDGILFRMSDTWMPYAKYADKGYTDTRTAYYTRANEQIGTRIGTVWTEEGRMFLHKHFDVDLPAVDGTMFDFTKDN